MIDWNSLPRPIVALAPMADMTDLPFCLICKQLGAPVVFREMVSSEAVVRGSMKTIEMARFDERERPIIQQIFGSDPKIMSEAAKIIEETFHPDGIDINMGCPAYKIVSNFDGSALMKDPPKAAEIVKAVRDAVSVPVSVKTRLGWSKDTDILDFVRYLEDAGASLITIHGRTKEQGYAGQANWDRVGEARARTSLPVIVNGDITSFETAKEAMKRANADGVMIGRGALGNPWIFQELAVIPAKAGIQTPKIHISLEERVAVAREHAKLHLAHYGDRGMVTFRKHLACYFKKELKQEYPHIDWADIRTQLVRVNTMEELEAILLRAR
jgi:tRNA-dihydrouridine synthase B